MVAHAPTRSQPERTIPLIGNGTIGPEEAEQLDIDGCITRSLQQTRYHAENLRSLRSTLHQMRSQILGQAGRIKQLDALIDAQESTMTTSEDALSRVKRIVAQLVDTMAEEDRESLKDEAPFTECYEWWVKWRTAAMATSTRAQGA